MRLKLMAAFGSMMLAAVPGAAEEPATRPACAAAIEEVSELLQQDSRLLSRRRDDLAAARVLCESGQDQEAMAILDDIRGSSMPMGMGQ